MDSPRRSSVSAEMKNLCFGISIAFAFTFFIASYLFVACVIPGYIIWKVIPIGWLAWTLIFCESIAAILFGVAWFAGDGE